MIDGLWTAEFGSSAGVFGGGVAVLRNGKVFGGDGGYFYLGEYTLTGNLFHASLEVIPFIQNYMSVFQTADKRFTLDLNGSLLDDNILKAQGHAREMPSMTFGVKLIKRAQIER